MASSTTVINHSSLGCSLRGFSTRTSVQYRNLKYASVPARYKDSIPNDSLRAGRDGTFDANKFGPSCPQKRGAQAFDLTLVGNVTLPCQQNQGETEKMDEFECLHVNVTVPKSTRQHLPVFVWVHGGALSIGSNNWPQYDLQKFVDRSVEIGKPVIGVAINYRLGLLGFAASKELGASGNMGFKDQILAFRWIKKHIAGFGGDPNSITAVGESAGGISLSTLLCANIGKEGGLFERVIIMSGETTLRKPRNTWWHEQMYKDQAPYLGIQAADLRTKLLHTDAEELAQQLPLAQHFCAHIDRSWLSTNPTLHTLADGNRPEHKPTWCKHFVVGDTAHDGTVLRARILDNPHAFALLISACQRHLTPTETARLFAAYHLDRNEHMLRALVSELRFYLPTLAVHKGWRTTSPPKSTGQYHFHIPNPFPGEYTGLSSHELDVAFLLQNFNHLLDERHRDLARGMADRFIGYVNGEVWAQKGHVVVFGENGVREVQESMYDEMYRDGRGKVLEGIGVEKCWRVAEMWQGVRREEEEGGRGGAKL